MPEVVLVDLSAKVEQWTKDTAVVFSNGIQGSVWVSSKTKQKLRDWLKTIYLRRRQAFYHQLIFALLIYLLIRPILNRLEGIIIDRDYPGQESEQMIKDFLLNFLHRDDASLRGTFIRFQEIKGSKADVMARGIYEQKKAPDRKINLLEMQRCFN